MIRFALGVAAAVAILAVTRTTPQETIQWVQSAWHGSVSLWHQIQGARSAQ